MLKIKLITTGSLSEKYWKDASNEYIKRLSSYASFTEVVLKEVHIPQSPNEADVKIALDEEAKKTLQNITSKSYVIALCVEGEQYSSSQLSDLIEKAAVSGKSEIVFIIGSAYGLSDIIKNRADVKLSLSKLTFPHQLSKVILLEAVYRALDIAKGGKYHKV